MALRFNIRKLKKLVWVLCILTLGYAGWTFFDIYSKKEDGHYNPRKTAFFREVLQRDISDASRDQRKEAFYPKERYEWIWNALVNGEVRQTETPEELVPEKPKEPVLPDLSTIAKVNMVFFSPDPVSRFIGITYQAADAKDSPSKQRRLHLSEGDPLRPPYDASPYNGRVLEIGLQEVTFQWGDGEVVLTPKLGADGAGLPLSQFDVAEYEDLAASVDRTPERSVELEPGHWLIGTEDVKELSRDPQAFLTEQVNVRTITQKSGRSQLEITHVEPGSLAAQYGAKEHDRIISINGIPMNSVAGAVAWFKQNSDLPVYEVVYERNGVQQSTTIHVK